MRRNEHERSAQAGPVEEIGTDYPPSPTPTDAGPDDPDPSLADPAYRPPAYDAEPAPPSEGGGDTGDSYPPSPAPR